MRQMRILVMYDLPVGTVDERKKMNQFRKFLKKNGFIMLQESVYTKLCLNNNSSKLVKNKIESNVPKNGSVIILEITEKQFASMEFVIGEKESDILDDLSRFILI